MYSLKLHFFRILACCVPHATNLENLSRIPTPYTGPNNWTILEILPYSALKLTRGWRKKQRELITFEISATTDYDEQFRHH